MLRTRPDKLGIDGTEPVNVGALVVNRRLLGLDFILGIDSIRASGGVTIRPAGVVSFAGRVVCTAIRLNKIDFSTEFNQTQNLETEVARGSTQWDELRCRISNLDTKWMTATLPRRKLGHPKELVSPNVHGPTPQIKSRFNYKLKKAQLTHLQLILISARPN